MPAKPWNHNIHYHPLVLRAVPPDCERALDVGCGRGLLTRELASRCRHVSGIDLDEGALAHAKAAGDAGGRVEYVLGDAMRHPFPPESFGFIAAVATLHHLPLAPALRRFAALLKPGGVLAVIGLYRSASTVDYANAALAIPASLVLQQLRGHADVGAPVRDPYETLSEIREISRRVLPGAKIRRQLLFRYSLFWKESQ